jgi:predicted nucleotidyltransferase
MTELYQQLAAVCRRFSVTSLYAFGSRSRDLAARCAGEEGDSSPQPSTDADIAVQPVPSALRSPRDRVALVGELETLFQVPRVDLVILPEASAFLAADAIRGELLFCEDENQQSREELYYLRRAGDLAPLEHERLRLLLAGELRQ